MKSLEKPDSELVLPVTVRLPKSVIERLESAAAGQGMTRSEYVRALLLDVRLQQSSTLLAASKDRAGSLKVLCEINRAGRQLEGAVRILERAEVGGHLDNDAVDRAAAQIASVDSALREALAHAVQD